MDEYENLDLIGNAKSDSVIYDLPPQRTGKRGRPALHGKKLSIQDDFTLSDEKIGDYYMAVRHVLTNIFGKRTVLAYVTSADKAAGSRRLFFSTVFSEQLQVFCAWQEKSPLNQTGSSRMQFIPLILYAFRWPIEVSYYEQKTFWSPYCAMKLLPYQDKAFYKYQTESVQEFRFALSEQIRQQVFYAIFVEKHQFTTF